MQFEHPIQQLCTFLLLCGYAEPGNDILQLCGALSRLLQLPEIRHVPRQRLAPETPEHPRGAKRDDLPPPDGRARPGRRGPEGADAAGGCERPKRSRITTGKMGPRIILTRPPASSHPLSS